MKEIPLTRGKVALVDDEDFEEVSSKKWRAQQGTSTWYAVESGNPYLSMHRFLMNPEETDQRLVVHHINGDGLDNRRCNLQVTTYSENNRRTRRPAKGYHWESWRRKWKAVININGYTLLLGRFDTEEEAAAAYQAKLKELGNEIVKQL